MHTGRSILRENASDGTLILSDVAVLPHCFRLDNAAVAWAILTSTSGLKPSSLIIAVKFLKLCTSSGMLPAIWSHEFRLLSTDCHCIRFSFYFVCHDLF